MTKEEKREYNKAYWKLHKRKKGLRKYEKEPRVYLLKEYDPVPQVNERTLRVKEIFCSECKRELNFREKLFGNKCIKCTN